MDAVTLTTICKVVVEVLGYMVITYLVKVDSPTCKVIEEPICYLVKGVHWQALGSELGASHNYDPDDPRMLPLLPLSYPHDLIKSAHSSPDIYLGYLDLVVDTKLQIIFKMK